MPTYLEIAVNVPQVLGVFHYHLPPALEGQVGPGHLVEVPFGKQMVQGVVLQRISQPGVPKTLPVAGLIDPKPALTLAQISLALEMSESTLAPLATCIDLMIPPGLSKLSDTLYTLNESTLADYPALLELPAVAQRLVKLLQKRGPLRGRQIEQSMPPLDWRSAARSLIRRDLLKTQSVLPPPSVHPKMIRTAMLACTPETAEAAMPSLGKAGLPALGRRQAILRYLMSEPGPVNVSWIYAASGGNLNDLRLLAERGLILLSESEIWRDPLEKLEFVLEHPPPLTTGQQAVWDQLLSLLQGSAAGQSTLPCLLHGVTGSGKTEIYLRAVDETLRQGRQAIVLVPEIALTPQTVRRFISRFPGRVGLAHSLLSEGERYDTWRRARGGDLAVMVGPRSALFTPFPQVGLIVVDECHDDSYYQSDMLPAYHAQQAAVVYARLAGAVCLLGSATPDVVSRCRAEAGVFPGHSDLRYHYLSLPARILAHRQVIQSQAQRLGKASQYHPYGEQAETIDLPPVQVVDMRQELKAGNASIFSSSLQAALKQVLANKQQAILFLNRRGTATYVFCRDCGYSAKCPRCDIPLTCHTKPGGQPAYLPESLPSISPGKYKLSCHYCGYTRQMMKICPQCGSRRIREYGTGTERVVEEVRSLFPEARTLRWDHESTRQKGSHEIIMSHFAKYQADVLVGTQMIAKGLDLPLVTLVGAVLADVGLNLPDYRAGERTFQVLTQVAGRAGRSPLGGQVILQTFQPDHYVIQAAAKHDYAGFYAKELAYRRRLRYPPFGRLVRMEYRHADAAQAEEVAQRMADQVRSWLEEDGRRLTDLIGPAPCFFSRLNSIYRWQIILRGPDPVSIIKRRQIGDWRIEVDPVSLL